MDRIIEKLDHGWWIVSHEQKLWLPHGELPHGDAFHDILLKNELHLDYSIEMIEFLHSELLASGYYSSLNCPTAQRPNELIEIKVRGKLPNNASTNGPNTGVFRLHF